MTLPETQRVPKTSFHLVLSWKLSPELIEFCPTHVSFGASSMCQMYVGAKVTIAKQQSTKFPFEDLPAVVKKNRAETERAYGGSHMVLSSPSEKAHG